MARASTACSASIQALGVPAVSAPISRAEPGGPAAGQQLEGDRGQREDVGGGAPRLARDALGRAVRAAHRRAQADPLQRFDDAEPGGARLFGRDEDVARMQRAVADAGGAREVDRAGELGDERQHRGDRRRRVVPHRDVERLGGDVLLGAVGDRPLDAGGDRLDDRRMEEPGLGGARQLVGQRLRLFGRDVEAEHLDRDQPVARRLVGAEDGTERANANLMQHPEGAELRGCREGRRVVSGQGVPRVGSGKFITSDRAVIAFRRLSTAGCAAAGARARDPAPCCASKGARPPSTVTLTCFGML